jgi:hypothetical protein
MSLSNNIAPQSQALSDFAEVLSPTSLPTPPRIALKPEDVQNGLGRLVLVLVELLRELLERQALRRIEGGSLTEAEVERLGTTFLRLAEQMERLKQEFGVSEEDLNIDVGPLGRLL